MTLSSFAKNEAVLSLDQPHPFGCNAVAPGEVILRRVFEALDLVTIARSTRAWMDEGSIIGRGARGV